jgi:cobalt-precorrin 5A hydrolase
VIAIGIGANSHARHDDFVAVIDGIYRETRGDVVATFEDAAFAHLVKAAASRRSLEYRPLRLEALCARNDDCLTRSVRTLDLLGIASMSEAAALAAAGSGSYLIMQRRIIGNITVAAAKSADAKDHPS